VIYETREGRPFWKLRPLQVLMTLVIVVLLAVMALGVVLTGPIVSAVAEPIGVSDTAVSVWKIAKWALIALLFVLMIGLLYYASPNVKQRPRDHPGGIRTGRLAVAPAPSASTSPARLNKTYGSLAGVS
jgi:membrane protein